MNYSLGFGIVDIIQYPPYIGYPVLCKLSCAVYVGPHTPLTLNLFSEEQVNEKIAEINIQCFSQASIINVQ